MDEKLATCEACGAEKSYGSGESIRYRCGSYRMKGSALVQMNGCFINQLSKLRQFETRVRQADKLHTIQDVAFAIRKICRE
jgi:hypothetical protein